MASSVAGRLTHCTPRGQTREQRPCHGARGLPAVLGEARVAREAVTLHQRCTPGRGFTAPCPHGRGGRVWTLGTRAPATRWTTPPRCPQLGYFYPTPKNVKSA